MRSCFGIGSTCHMVLSRAKKRGLPQLGTLGAGNHYAEIQVESPGLGWLGLLAQVVDEIYDKFAASKMGIEHTGQVEGGVICTATMCVKVVLMIHCGSRGFGHQVSTTVFTTPPTPTSNITPSSPAPTPMFPPSPDPSSVPGGHRRPGVHGEGYEERQH